MHYQHLLEYWGVREKWSPTLVDMILECDSILYPIAQIIEKSYKNTHPYKDIHRYIKDKLVEEQIF
jgi:hypothetical protein